MNKSILDWLEASVLSKPDKIALCDENSSLTYSQLRSVAQSIGSAIADSGYDNEERPILVISGRHTHTLATYLGVLYSGGYYIPIDTSSPKPHIERIVSASNAKLILVDRQGYDVVQSIDYQGKVICVDDVLNHKIDSDRLTDILNRHIDIAPLYVIFTSGSTGMPKGVVTPHRAVATFVEGYISAIGITEQDIIGSQSPLDYVGVVKDFYTTLRLGATMAIIPKRYFVTTNELINFLNNNKVTVIAWTVAALTIPIDNGTFDTKIPEHLRLICFTGSVMHPKHLCKLQAKLPQNIEYINLYGPTELTSNCLYYKITSQVTEDSIIPIGIPFEGYRIFIINDEGQEAKPGEIGELYVGGSALSLGYYNNPELTNQIFVQNPLHNTYRDIVYKTGDYCSAQAGGNYLFHGRKDRMVKSHGYRIELDEIESISKTLPEVGNCVCLFDSEKEQLYLFYQGLVDEKNLFIFLRKELPAYKVPRKIIRLDQIPLMKNFKIDMTALKKIIYEGK